MRDVNQHDTKFFAFGILPVIFLRIGNGNLVDHCDENEVHRMSAGDRCIQNLILDR